MSNIMAKVKSESSKEPPNKSLASMRIGSTGHRAVHGEGKGTLRRALYRKGNGMRFCRTQGLKVVL